jgi:primosomal protein N' (replication factor Y)
MVQTSQENQKSPDGLQALENSRSTAAERLQGQERTAGVVEDASVAFVQVAVPGSTRQMLTYQIHPQTLARSFFEDSEDVSAVQTAVDPTGAFVRVNIRGREKVGVVWQTVSRPAFACKEVSGPLWGSPVLPFELRTLLEWASRYYLCPVPRLIHLCAPGPVWKSLEDERRGRRMAPSTSSDGLSLRGELSPADGVRPALAPEQTAAVEAIFNHQSKGAVATLLQGVTGSGKTEVYLAVAERVLAHGQSVLILVPEIALTPQMTARFRQVFGGRLAVLHSGVTTRESEREWYRVASGQAQVVLGVRRGVFAPLRRIGLIVVDEEHDSSYKADDFPCFHARDVAVKRAQIEGALCVLGSASPSLESIHNAREGRYGLCVLKGRHKGDLPQIEVLDSRHFYKGLQKVRDAERSTGFSFQGQVILPQILRELGRVCASGQQAIIIVNRRGYASFAICLDCGHAQTCPHCDVTTTLHKNETLEVCHHCGHQGPASRSCGSCGGLRLESRGFGTQMIESEIRKHLPELKFERLDRDVLTSSTRLKGLLERFRMGEIQALVGTQILSKGHDFPKVSLVCVLHLEDSLFLPDFRSSERTYQLLLQSAGRAGRGEWPGRVLVQSLQPDHAVLQSVVQGKGEAFFRNELSLRQMAGLPPFCRQILIELSNSDDELLSEDALTLRRLLDQHVANMKFAQSENPGVVSESGRSRRVPVRILGPHPAPVERIRSQWRCQILMSFPRGVHPLHLVPEILHSERFRKSQLRIDVDPHRFL